MTVPPMPLAPGPIPLADSCIYLGWDGAMAPHEKTGAFLTGSARDPALKHGYVLAIHAANGPRDVHYPIWEAHPAGDELLILSSGSLSVELHDGERVRTFPLAPQESAIVPAGLWHRLVVHEPSVLMAVTPRHETKHAAEPQEKAEGQ